MDFNLLLERRQKLIKIKLTEILKQDLASSAASKITITKIILNKSLENATVFYMPFPGEEKIVEKEINSKLHLIYFKLMKALKTKKSPRLKFIFDKGVAHSFAIDKLLKEINS